MPDVQLYPLPPPHTLQLQPVHLKAYTSFLVNLAGLRHCVHRAGARTTQAGGVALQLLTKDAREV